MARDKAYQKAEQKIEEARRLGAKELDLSVPWDANKTLKLIELPESLGQLTELQTLNLSHNQLAALPEWLGQLTGLQTLNLSHNQLAALPEWLGQFTGLQTLNLFHNQLWALPESLGQLTQLQKLDLSDNHLAALPEWLGQLTQLRTLSLFHNQLAAVPESFARLENLTTLVISWNHFKSIPRVIFTLSNVTRLYATDNQISELPSEIGRLSKLQRLTLGGKDIAPNVKFQSGVHGNQITSLPAEILQLNQLTTLELDDNPLSPELAAAYEQGLDAVKRYLRAKTQAQVVLNEAKLILVGEGEVGKSCLLGALRGDPWEEGRPTTHGIEIKPVKVTDPATGTEITLNGWDFGGQRVYRPTHQLFFSAPAIYLVVWKPREGPQQGFVKEWIKLVKHREPEAKVLVVATHGGPKERQPDIDRQELWDLFGRDTVIDFFHVQSRPPKLSKKTGKRTGTGTGIKELRDAIAKVAASLPEVGRAVPKHWQEVREALRNSKAAYLPLTQVLAICKDYKIEEEGARLLLRICRRVGDLIHYEHDPVLKEIVVIKPDWLATAMSFVLDDAHTREVGHGLVSFARLGQLWNDSARSKENRYSAKLHPIFLRLMERFDLSYRVAEAGKTETDGTSLIAQLVPDVRPDPVPGWEAVPAAGDVEQVQICRIMDTTNNQSATAEGLFYQLIVRLHKYSLGRADHGKSSHWQRGLVLEDDTGARAFLEHVGNDVRITVRSPYPERFLSALTYEVKWLVEDFWKGMRCEVTVPCLLAQPNGDRCKGLFEVVKLIESKREGYPKFPCPVCNRWQEILSLLQNAPAAGPNPMEELLDNFAEVKGALEAVLRQLGTQHVEVIGRFNQVDAGTREMISKVEAAYSGLMHSLLDEAKEGPRLFSFEPVEPGFFDRPKWISAKFKIMLWCEHSRVPLWRVASDPNIGVYTVDLPREWLVQAAPFLKVLSSTLGLMLPVVAAIPKVALPEIDYKKIEGQLTLGKSAAESLLKGGGQVGEWLVKNDGLEIAPDSAMRAKGAVLRQLHAWLKEKDPGFGGLVRVQNKRQEFLWVHTQFEKEY